MMKPNWDKAFTFLSSLANPVDKEKTENATPQAASTAPTVYWIDNGTEKVYLSEKHPDVVAVRLIAWEFAQLVNNRDYTSIDGSVEYHLYTKELMQKLVKKRDHKKTTKYIKKNKLKSQCTGCRLTSISFNEELNEAEVLFHVQITVLAASDKYFKTKNKGLEGKILAKKGLYEQLYRLTLCQEAELWKISNFEWDEDITLP